MSHATTPQGFSTRAIHHGYNPADHQGALVPPIYTSATFAFPDVAYGMRCFTGGYEFLRTGTVTENDTTVPVWRLRGGGDS